MSAPLQVGKYTATAASPLPARSLEDSAAQAMRRSAGWVAIPQARYCPTIPPEVALLPFNLLYQMSSWTRAIAISLSIVHAANPCAPVPAGFRLDELWLPGVSPAFRRDSTFTWHNFFLTVDQLFKLWERSGSKAIRCRAV